MSRTPAAPVFFVAAAMVAFWATPVRSAEGESGGEAPAGYAVHAFDGRSFRVDTLAQLDGRPALLDDGEVVVLQPGAIDYYTTFLSNLEGDGGNVVVFQSGRFLRYENLRLEEGKAIIDVGGGSVLVVAEHLIDFRASVLEGATVELPRGVGELGVAKGDSRSPRRISGTTPRTRSVSRASRGGRTAEERREALEAARKRLAERRRQRRAAGR